MHQKKKYDRSRAHETWELGFSSEQILPIHHIRRRAERKEQHANEHLFSFSEVVGLNWLPADCFSFILIPTDRTTDFRRENRKCLWHSGGRCNVTDRRATEVMRLSNGQTDRQAGSRCPINLCYSNRIKVIEFRVNNGVAMVSLLAIFNRASGRDAIYPSLVTIYTIYSFIEKNDKTQFKNNPTGILKVKVKNA